MIDTQLLRKEMEDKNMNISRLSELSGVDKSAISRLVNGESKTCTVETAQNISNALKLNHTKRGLIFFANQGAKKQLTNSN